MEDELRAKQDYIRLSSGLPPSTDKEFLQAKVDYARKRDASHQVVAPASSIPAQIKRRLTPRAPEEGSTGGVFAPPSWSGAEQSVVVKVLLQQAPSIMRILSLLSEHGGPQQLWLTGGALRNTVWDAVHRYAVPTPFDDVDVIYYDPSDISLETERSIESKLGKLAPNVRWDVKNEARMADVVGDPPYRSLSDALVHSPETASALAARKTTNEQIELIAPHGLDDLLKLVLRGPNGDASEKMRARINQKRWLEYWPKLVVE
jgi:hypothetical protein